MWGMLCRTFKYMSSSIFVPLYKTMVRSHLDYASSVWSPYTKKHVGMIGVQRRATNQLPGLSEMSYQERLQYLKLLTLAYRRMRGDMIQVYKMISGRYESLFDWMFLPGFSFGAMFLGTFSSFIFFRIFSSEGLFISCLISSIYDLSFFSRISFTTD